MSKEEKLRHARAILRKREPYRALPDSFKPNEGRPLSATESTVERFEDWWCWECANLGMFPEDFEMGTPEMECPCCENNSHDFDAEVPPPCHPRAPAATFRSEAGAWYD